MHIYCVGASFKSSKSKEVRTRRKTWGHNRGRFLILESRYLRELAAYHPASVVSEDDLPLGGDLSEKKNN